jgi:outer membrane protein assembly factor BamB
MEIAADGSAIYVAGGAPRLRAFAADDGRPLWSLDAPAAIGRLVSGGGRVFLVADAAARLLTADGPPAGVAAAGDAPILAAWQDGLVLAAADRRVFVFTEDDGRLDATYELAASLAAPPVVIDGLVVAATREPSLVAIDRRSGAVAWRVALAFQPESIAAGDGRVFLTGDDRALHACRARNGQAEWRFPLYVGSRGVAVDDRAVYVALFDNTVLAFGARSGTRMWHRPVSGRPTGLLSRQDDRLIVALVDGVVAVLDAGSGAPKSRLSTLENDGGRLEAAQVMPDGRSVVVLATKTSGLRVLALWPLSP